jgi:Fe-S cluster assembly iron-binding protein IscA
MLILTERAATVIRSIAEQPGLEESAGLRIAATPDGERGLSATPVANPELGDQVIEDDGARVFLDAEAANRLEDQVLDAVVDEGNRVEFVLAGQPG